MSENMDRKKVLQKYLEKYSSGVFVEDQSLGLYEKFFQKIFENDSLQEIVEKKIHAKKPTKIFDIGCGNAEALRELKYTYLKDIYCV
ncbi:MAG: hypothetical protein Q7K42_06065, partial [Candidatus Diapherotrites archaeon]|nr:hypothetical protein [Candidatus Diapherotrites archaeon]